MTTTWKKHDRPALPDPMDRKWGLCPKCRQSAQARVARRLICYRCKWVEPNTKWSREAVG